MANKVVIETELNSQPVTRSCEEIQKDIDKVIRAQEKLQERFDKFDFAGGNKASKTFQNMRYDADKLNTKMFDLQDEMARAMAANGEKEKAQKIEQVKNASDRASKSIKKMGNSAKKSSSGFSIGLKTILKYAFSVESVFMLVNKMRRALVEGFKNIAQFNDGINPVNSSLSSLKSALTQLKNSFAVAFAPILTTVEPILTRLIGILSNAMNTVGQFFAALTGAKTFTKAIKTQENYAKSLGSTAKNAKDAKKQLFGIYDLNNRTTTDNTDAESGTANPNKMFEVAPIENEISNFAGKIKELFESGDYGTIAKMIGEKFSDSIIVGIQTLKDKIKQINWEEIGIAIGSFINAIDWAGIVINMLGLAKEILNALIEAFEGLQETSPLAAAILILIGSAVSTIKVANLVITLTPLATKFIQAFTVAIEGAGLSGALETLLGTAGKNAVGGFNVLGGSILGLTNFVDMLVNGFDWLNEVLMIVGITLAALGAIILGAPALVAGIIAAIIAAVATLVVVIKDNWEFVKKLFTSITNIIFGVLIVAFYDIVDAVGSVIKTVISLFQNLWKSLKQIFSGIINFVIGVFTLDFEKAWNGIVSVFKGIINTIISIFEAGINLIVSALNFLSFDIPDIVPGIGGKHIGIEISPISLPKLATGTVVPRQSREFMAVLGDNNRETEVVSPMSTMKHAFMEALAESGMNGSRNINVILEGDAKGVFRLVRTEESNYYNMTGQEVFVH